MRLPTRRPFDREILVAGGLLFLVLAAKLPTLTLPLHWDEASAYASPSYWLADQGLTHAAPGRHPPGKFFGHPPGLYLLLGTAVGVFGRSVVVPHLLSALFAFLGLLATYRLGRFLSGRPAGVLAALILFAMPLYFAQAGMFLADLPIAAMGTLCVLFAFTGRRLPYLAAGAAMVLLKETSVAVPVALAAVALVRGRGRRDAVREAAFLALPVLMLAGFFLWQRLAYGQFFLNPYFADRPALETSPSRMAAQLGWASLFLYGMQGRWVLTGVIVIGVALARAWRREYAVFVVLQACFLGAFTSLFFMTRYLTPLLPGLAIMGAGSIVALSRLPRVRWALAMVVLVSSAVTMHGGQSGYRNFDEDMQYVDMIEANRETCAVAAAAGEVPISAAWPLSAYLTEPALGYVDTPVTLASPADRPGLYLAGVTEAVPGARVSRRIESNGKTALIYHLAPGR